MPVQIFGPSKKTDKTDTSPRSGRDIPTGNIPTAQYRKKPEKEPVTSFTKSPHEQSVFSFL
jgi:hypothetical protein